MKILTNKKSNEIRLEELKPHHILVTYKSDNGWEEIGLVVRPDFSPSFNRNLPVNHYVVQNNSGDNLSFSLLTGNCWGRDTTLERILDSGWQVMVFENWKEMAAYFASK